MSEPNQPPPEQENDDDRQPVSVTMEQLLDVLQDGEMDAEHGMLRWSSNYTFLVTMRHEEFQVPAVYKPQRGERPLWDFPDGTLCKRETASFLTSEMLGWQVVPPTVLREGVRGLGSVQFYIDHDPGINYFSFDDSIAPQLAVMALFDVLVNNADRKGGHCLLDPVGKLWGIDHGITFNEDYKLRTVIWDFAGQPIPQPLMEDVERVCDQINKQGSPFLQQMSDLLFPREIDAFRRRIERIVNRKVYPTPGPGPNYPWPAV